MVRAPASHRSAPARGRSIAAALAALATLAAAAPAPDAAPLTLAQAVERAQKANETAGVAAARVERARASLREARAALLPALAATATYTRRSAEVTRNLGGSEVTIQAEDALGANVTLDVPVFDAAAWNRLERAGHAAEAQRLDAQELTRALAFDVAESFFAVLSAESLLEAAQRRDEFAKAGLDEARRRQAAGLGARGDTSRAEVEAAAAQVALVRARGTVRAARLSLGYLVGEAVDGPLAEPAEEPAAAADAPALEREAASRRADVAARAAAVRAAEVAAKEPWLRLVPVVGVRALGRATNEAGLSGRSTDWSLSATLTWALYDGGLRYAQAAARSAEVREASLGADALRRRLGLEIRQALESLETAEAAVAGAEVQARAAGENAADVNERSLRGLATALERADASTGEFEARAALARERFARRVARLALLRALGRWPQAEEGR